MMMGTMMTIAFAIYTIAFDGLDKTIKLFSLFVVCIPFCDEEDGCGGAIVATDDDADEDDDDE